jgi:hypothetical protein
VARHGGDKGVRSLTCAEQFRAMAFAQLTYRESLRDIEACLLAQAAKLYHMGFREPVARSTLADANESRDWRIWEAFAGRLIIQARELYLGEDLGLDLTNTVYALDSTTIDLCLSVFPWAHFRTTKAAVKMHTLLDLKGSIPSFIHVSDGKLHDVHALDLLELEAGAIYVMDRGYVDFARLHALHLAGAFFVTRAKSNMKWHRVYSMPTDRTTGIICDQRIALDGFYTQQGLPRPDAPGTFQRSGDRQDAHLHYEPDDLAGHDDLRALQESLAGRTVLQVDQAASADQNDFSEPRRMRSRRKSGSRYRFMCSSPSSRKSCNWTPRSTLCYRFCRSPFSRRCPCSKPFQPASTFFQRAYRATN